MHETVTIQEFVDIYSKVIKSRLRSHAQIRRHLNRISAYFSGRAINTIRRNDIAEYAEYRLLQGVTPASINIELAVFSAAINYAKKRWELSLHNAVTGLFYPSKPGRLRYLEREEAEILLYHAGRLRSPYLADFIELALNTGARKNEILQLQFKSVDLQRKIITIEAYTTKTGKRRYLPINQSAGAVLERRKAYRDNNCIESPWVFSKRLGGRIKYPDNAFRVALKAAGIQDFTVHDLRHTFASWLVSEGVELIKVRDLLGHSSIRMTERYAHLAPYRLHEAVSVLDGFYGQHSLELGC
jgi:integrase